ncbi:hypothetical protein K1X76_11620 [bacterium]|nr:hypothetical protein [bacterium]
MLIRRKIILYYYLANNGWRNFLNGMIFLVLVLTLDGCGKTSTVEILPSPSSQYVLKTDINLNKTDKTKYLCVKLYLLDKNGVELDFIQTGASDTMKWAVGWMGDVDVIVLNSADIGTLAWKVSATNQKLETIVVDEQILQRGRLIRNIKYRSN